ncbi:MAG: arylsulfotransferase family protein [Alphaproteobacteria bacterium]
MSLIDISDHTVNRTIVLDDVHNAVDEEVSIFNLGRTDDPWHNNDVEPLPADIADRFPFNAGDLLVSYRHLNLVYVLDPETLQTKWWTNDYTGGQHDPDWEPDGTISVYDNRALGKRGKFSTVQKYDLNVAEPELALDGRDYGFYSGIGGKHTLFDDGSILALSYGQGRVLWVGPDKDVRFEFVNLYDDNETLAILNTGYLPADYFDVEITAPCN